ncbi:dihydroorotate dehydrogenase [Desulfuribacillus stibiiarsenatis]|uniref:dihydrouracil dehydrogenase (NAD(+)) n=1 Tax=Desulfuribacillus stibiiarsenatis TaxID=1390249 RepID=A0A1E5L288_9FIRM|nr:NAD-dependent dihydropyrimidine dehydrogenase subunit PreA [Desulfuribacillus stibiiarsenatis]OEH84268.1 dihydroorotate dehydrogenase [Desulfuribacillus stibiiarsenatis]
MVDLSLEFCGVKYPNPFVLAAAPTTDHADMVARAFEAGWGGAVLKTTSVESEEINLAYPMMAGTDFEKRKLMALQNIDLISIYHVDVIEKSVKQLKKEFPDRVVVASIMGQKKEDWQELVRRLEIAGADMIECSFSCPHGMPEKGMGSTIGQSPELTERTARWIKEAAKKIPVVIKLTPQIADISASAAAVKASGADGVSAINTVKGIIGVDIDNFIPYPNVNGKSSIGGISGAAIKPVALRCVAEIAKKVDIPITATGGITTWQDAVEFLLMGARNLQLCTVVMQKGFGVIDELVDGLTGYMKRHGFQSVEEIVGKALPNLVEHSQLPRHHKALATVNHEICIKCGRCTIACYDGGHQAITRDADKRPIVDEQRCVGCGFCTTICPVPNCLTMKFL